MRFPSAARWSFPLFCAVALVGCPKAAPTDPARVRSRRARPLPVAETAVAVEGFLRPHPKPGRLRKLPPFPRFRDPYGLPRRSLKKERRLAYRVRGKKRHVLITHIAARLWRLANQKIDKIRALIAAAKGEGRPPPRDRIEKLQRKVSAHLRECVTLLEGVLENKRPPEMARVRLAHYLRKLKPVGAAKLFVQLLADVREPRRRTAYGLDLAQLWVGLGKPAAAWKVLVTTAKDARGARALLLRALSLARSGGSTKRLQKVLKRLLGVAGKGPLALRRSVVHHLPALLARVGEPARQLQDWSRVDAAGFKVHGSAVSARLVQRLMDRGSLESARRVLRAVGGQGRPGLASLRARVLRLAGPWRAQAEPPPAVSWTAQVRARLPAVTRCFQSAGHGLRAWRLVLLVAPDGSVRAVSGGAMRLAQRPGRKVRSTPPPGAGLRRCIARVARGWHFPPWRAERSIRLTATLRLGSATL